MRPENVELSYDSFIIYNVGRNNKPLCYFVFSKTDDLNIKIQYSVNSIIYHQKFREGFIISLLNIFFLIESDINIKEHI